MSCSPRQDDGICYCGDHDGPTPAPADAVDQWKHGIPVARVWGERLALEHANSNDPMCADFSELMDCAMEMADDSYPEDREWCDAFDGWVDAAWSSYRNAYGPQVAS